MLAVFADDLTGAAATAALLRERGARVLLSAHAELRPIPADTDAIVVDTRTRDLADAEARRRLGACLDRLLRQGPRPTLFGRRIDTTLRGPIVAEIEVLTEQLRPTWGLLSPAYPAAGRTTRDGVHYVRGERLADLRDLLASLAPATRIGTQQPDRASPGTWWIPDYRHPADAAGIAGIARALGDVLVVDSGPVFAELLGRPPKRVLVVQGSSRPELEEQIAALRQSLAGQYAHILYAPLRGREDPELERLIRAARRELDRGDIAGVVVGGGMTAEALLDAMAADDVQIVGSPEPLVGITRLASGPYAGTLLVTKGGAIGNRASLQRLVSVVRMLAAVPLADPGRDGA